MYMCFVDLEKAFDKVSSKVTEWALRKRDVQAEIEGAVMSFKCGSKNKS